MATLGLALFPEYPPDQYQHLARRCEELGYTNVWVPDERFWRDIATCMSQAVMATDTIMVGSSVTDPYIRHPALTAQMMATLDELSGGRVVVGLGAGIAGFKALGIERNRPVRAMREAIELMRALWTGDTVDYQGEMIQFHDASFDFHPIRDRIPIYVAGRGPLVLSLAGELGDGAMIGSLASRPGLTYAFNRIRIGLLRAGRELSDIDVTLWLHTAISEDGEAAYEAVRTIVTGVLISSLDTLDELGLDIPQAVQESLQGVTYGVNSPEMQRARSVVTPDIIRHFAVAGSPDQCREQIREMVDAGVNHFAVVPWLTPEQSLEDFAELLIESLGPALKRND